MTVLTLELISTALPPGRKIAFDLRDQATLASLKKNPVTIKEGIEYKYVEGTLV